jgi:hypothetical protein
MHDRSDGRRRLYLRRDQRLRADEALKLREQIAARLRWLNKLQARMQQIGFPPMDKLRAAVLAASPHGSALRQLQARRGQDGRAIVTGS